MRSGTPPCLSPPRLGLTAHQPYGGDDAEGQPAQTCPERPGEEQSGSGILQNFQTLVDF